MSEVGVQSTSMVGDAGTPGAQREVGVAEDGVEISEGEATRLGSQDATDLGPGSVQAIGGLPRRTE